MSDDEVADFERFRFPRDGIDRPVFVRGEGPPVLVMHELPGLSPAALDFGRRLARQGFRVHLPLLFGRPGQHEVARSTRELCVSREFARLAAGKSAPIVDWLRALTTEISRRQGGAKVGVIGMCLTGAFAIPLLAVPCVAASVAAQPGVPFSLAFSVFGWLGIGRGPWMAELNVSEEDLCAARERAREQKVPLLAVRFASDRVCPRARLDRLERAFGTEMIRKELPGGSWLRRWLSPPHATLTEEFRNAPSHPTHELFEQVTEFLRERLIASPPAGGEGAPLA